MQRSEIHRLQANYEHFITLTATRGTAERYSDALESFFSRFQDKFQPEEFTRRDIEDYRVERLREGKSPRTVNYEVAVVKAFWNWMLQMERVTWNPAAQVKRLKEKDAPKTCLNVAEQLQLQKGCYRWGDRALVGLALTTGLRGETLVALEKSEINFERGCITIPAEKMKAGRTHEVPVPAWVLGILAEAPEGGSLRDTLRTRRVSRIGGTAYVDDLASVSRVLEQLEELSRPRCSDLEQTLRLFKISWVIETLSPLADTLQQRIQIQPERR